MNGNAFVQRKKCKTVFLHICSVVHMQRGEYVANGTKGVSVEIAGASRFLFFCQKDRRTYFDRPTRPPDGFFRAKKQHKKKRRQKHTKKDGKG